MENSLLSVPSLKSVVNLVHSALRFARETLAFLQ